MGEKKLFQIIQRDDFEIFKREVLEGKFKDQLAFGRIKIVIGEGSVQVKFLALDDDSCFKTISVERVYSGDEIRLDNVIAAYHFDIDEM